MTAYYNEIDPSAAAWLRQLIKAGHIAAGDVDERSIVDVRPDDLRGYTQCHWFAGIGGWSYALRLAGWPDDRPVWTGSCPCQPFSAAGKQRGSDDERHLWPAFFDLIRECRPRVVVGEQVAGAAGYAWADHVGADVESEGYAFAAADIGAHSVGAPHLRQRLYWVALANADGRHASAERQQRSGQQRQQPQDGGACCDLADPAPRGQRIDGGASRQAGHAAQRDATCGLADAEHAQRWPVDEHGQDGRDGQDSGRTQAHGEPRACGEVCRLADSDSAGRSLERQRGLLDGQRPALRDDADGCGADGLGDATGDGPQGRDEPGQRPDAQREAAERASALDAGRMGDAEDVRHEGRDLRDDREQARRVAQASAWRDLEWIACSDGKARPAQRAILRMANGLSNRMVCRCNRGLAFVSKAAEEGVSYAAESNSSTATSVYAVLVCDGAETLPGRGLGVHEQLPAAEVLQSGLHVEGVRGTNQGAQREELTPAVGQGCEGGMRGVWKDKHFACPSCGRESFEQLAVQFEDLVREMPPGSTFAQLLGAEGSAFMQALRKAGDADRPLLDTQHPGAEVWRSLADEEKDRLQVRFGEGCWTLESRVFPLAHGLPAGLVRGSDQRLAPDDTAEGRVMRLRGYGNAIVPQVAAAFVMAALEVPA